MSEQSVERDPRSARYALSKEELQRLTQAFLHDFPPHTEGALVCYEVDTEEMCNVARTIECKVFEKYFGNNPEEMARIYGPYEDASNFFLLIDQRLAEPVGTLRVINNSPAGMMTLNTLPEDASPLSPAEIATFHGIEDMEKCWDVGTVAVLPEHQGQDAAILLYRAMYKAACEADIEHVVSIIDERPYEKMTKYLGIPFQPLAGTRPFAYEGSSTSRAVYGHIPDFYPVMRKHMRFSVKGWMAHSALKDLVRGKNDDAIQLR